MKIITGSPLRRAVLKDRVSELIKEAILDGKLEPGERIVETKLAEDLGVGTTAVREALFELESQGFVSRVTNKGTFVTQLNAEDVEQILRVRAELEGLAVELAAGRASEGSLRELDSVVEEMRRAAERRDLGSFYRADLEFHRGIWSLSGNRYLERLLDITVVPLFAFFIMRNPSDSTDELLESVDVHRRIVDAIRRNESPRKTLEDAMRFFTEQEKWLLFGKSR